MRPLIFSSILVTLTLALTLPAQAQRAPTPQQIERDLRRAFSSAVEVRLRPDAAQSRQLGPSRWEHQQMVEVVSPTSDFPGVPGARSVHYGGAIFLSSDGRRWTYDRFTSGEVTYEGVPTPSVQELTRFFRSRRYADFFQYEAYILGMPELTPTESGCRWHSPTQLECSFTTVIDMRRGNSIARMRRRVRVTLWRAEGQESFDRYSTSWSDDGRPERIDPSPEELAARQPLSALLAGMSDAE